MSEETSTRFSTTLPIVILTRPLGQSVDWQEFDRGPGYFSVPEDQEIRVRIKGISDDDMPQLVRDLQNVATLRFLDLAENRNVSNDGIKYLRNLTQLTGLNLSSCTITTAGLEQLTILSHLAYLNLSYCNKLKDPVLKTIQSMRNLLYVDLKGCLSITTAGLVRVRRKNLTINRD